MQPLRPFHSEPWLEEIQLEASALWQAGVLSVAFELSDRTASVLLPAASANPARRDGLWQSTCFEAFLSPAGAAHYWELNLAPNGDWNLYRLDSYRQGLQPEAAIAALPYRIQRAAGRLRLQVDLPLQGVLPESTAIEVSLTAVLDQDGHGCSYWAWRHVAAEPDFHQRASFEPTQNGNETAIPSKTTHIP
jgi:hypothetical protein